MNQHNLDLLKLNGLPPPPAALGQELYEWLAAAQGELGCSFISRVPISDTDLSTLIRRFGQPPPELRFYYSRSTPWEYGIDDYLSKVAAMSEECGQVLRRARHLTEHGSGLEIERGVTLWPVGIYSTNGSALAFVDAYGRLPVISSDVVAGFGWGRPLAIGLRNYFVMKVINQIVWYETEGEKSFIDVGLTSEVLEVGGWPDTDPPVHPAIECFKLRSTSR
jgi:hypothetical protein